MMTERSGNVRRKAQHDLQGRKGVQQRAVRQGGAGQGVEKVEGNGVHAQSLERLGHLPALGQSLTQPEDPPGAHGQPGLPGVLDGGHPLGKAVGGANPGEKGRRGLQVVVKPVQPRGLQLRQEAPVHNPQGGADADGHGLFDGGHRR